MIKYYGAKITANEYAKMVVQDKGESSMNWDEFNEDVKAMTQKEREEIDAAITKHLKRVWKFLGCSKVWDKTRK